MRVSLAQAAKTLGVSERTIRRRLAAGQLDGIQMQSDTGPRWLIEVPDAAPEASLANHLSTEYIGGQGGADPTLAAILEQIRALHAEVAELRAELGLPEQYKRAPALLPGPEPAPWWRRMAWMIRWG